MMSNAGSFSKGKELIQYEEISLIIQCNLLSDHKRLFFIIQICSESTFII